MTLKFKGVTLKISVLYWALLCFVLTFDSSQLMVIMLLSITFHEICHILCMLSLGVRVTGIYFEPFGIIVAKQETQLSKAGECAVSLSGVAGNAVTAAAAFTAYEVFHYEVFAVITAVNVCLFCFNVLPVTGLDGGDVVRILLPEKVFGIPKNKAVKILNITVIAGLILIFSVTAYKYNFNITLLIVILNLAFVGIFKAFC